MSREEAYAIVEADLRQRVDPTTFNFITITLGISTALAPFLFVSDYLFNQGSKYSRDTSSLIKAVDSLFPNEPSNSQLVLDFG